ncbi:MAG TPA: LptE family protein [Nitrospirota bacterium]|nr:LptE family protein [Nitrospirota bacterium]
MKYAALLCSFLLLSACGYQMAGTGSHLKTGMKSLSIPVFENKTMEPIIEEELTLAAVREFLKDGRIVVVDSSKADMILKGSVVSYKETPLSFDASQIVEYRVTITTHLILQENIPISTSEREGPVSSVKPLWEKEITSTAEYKVSSDIMSTRISKLSALREIARNLSEEVSDRVLLGW